MICKVLAVRLDERNVGSYGGLDINQEEGDGPTRKDREDASRCG